MCVPHGILPRTLRPVFRGAAFIAAASHGDVWERRLNCASVRIATQQLHVEEAYYERAIKPIGSADRYALQLNQLSAGFGSRRALYARAWVSRKIASAAPSRQSGPRP